MSSTEQSALQPLPGCERGPSAAVALLEEFSALMRQIGSPAGWFDLPIVPTGWRWDQPAGVSGLNDFLDYYHRRLLAPVELPAIVRACACGRDGQSRELIGLDRQLACQPLLAPFAWASRRVGRWQLERLRPLRDQRTVQRYRLAVVRGQAQGWHPVVYGLTLAVYSWPLRQGLMVYARQTLVGLAQAAAASESMSDPAREQILESVLGRVPATVEQAIGLYPIC